MGGGRKNLKRAVEEEMGTLQHGHSVMQVVNLRGSNLLEVMDKTGEKLLSIFPAKFQRSMWTKRGNFVVVDETGRVEAIKSGRKVGGIVTQVLYHEQVCVLQKAPEWPNIFTSKSLEHLKPELLPSTTQKDEECSSDDDGLPPLEANTNRLSPLQSHMDTSLSQESDSDIDT